jgi:hypothetical protein
VGETYSEVVVEWCWRSWSCCLRVGHVVRCLVDVDEWPVVYSRRRGSWRRKSYSSSKPKVKASEQLTVKLDYPYLGSGPNSGTTFLHLTSFSKNSLNVDVDRY